MEAIIWTLKHQLGLQDHGGRVPAGLWTRIVRRLLALNTVIWHNWSIGGIHSRDGSVTLNGFSAIKNNTANFDKAGGIFNGGFHNKATVTLNDASTITGNTAKNQGGGVYNQANGATDRATATLNGSTQIKNNTAGNNGGGVLNCRGGSTTVNRGAKIIRNKPDNTRDC